MAVGVYLSSLHGPFLFDDEALVDRPITSGYSEAVHRSSLNRKIPFISFAFSRALSGWHTWGWHLPNVLLHALVSVVMWRWLLALGFFSAAGSWFAAAFFALHPAQTMAVSYIYQRSTLFAALFMLGAALCHLRALRGRDNRWLFGTAACALLSALSKETALALPFLLLLQEKALRAAGGAAEFSSPRNLSVQNSDFFSVQNSNRLRLGFVVFFAASYLAILSVRLFQVGGVGGVYPVPANLTVTWPQHVMTQVLAWPFYIVRWVWPFYQNADPHIRMVMSPLDGRWILALAFWACAAFFAWRVRKKRPAVLFGIAWFWIVLAPEMFGIRDVFFEHRAYFANAGLCVASCSLLGGGSKPFLTRRQMLWVALAALTVLGATTVVRNRVWNSEVLFWKDVVHKSPGKPRGYLNLGAAYERTGDFKQAKEYFEQVLRMESASARVKALSNLGMLDVREGRYHAGLLRLRAATRMSPSFQRHFFFMGLAMEKMGQFRAAYHWYRRTALIRDMESAFQWQAANNLANLLLRRNRLTEADSWIELGLRLRPDEPILLLNKRNVQIIRRQGAKTYTR